ncbi:hypothetical protein [Bacterioplanoides sp. SCSIO 12839]|uniref:hypothetical protein n=1 Tax=Bacterioplanoides sp. SCSIO 12839 TaxID=2829569 RepID=UPI0021082AAE|nr:hypothetical protein [Bacterioplanoides sp. SCSIO 12839]UTW49459.1 hypothetical protein KFF03_06040 [Bacterioplanoides sp. SCSIO 12839]
MITNSGTLDAKSIFHHHEIARSSDRKLSSKKPGKQRRTIMSDYIEDLLDIDYDDYEDDIDDAVEL